ncbi:MAG: hypothetical protein SFY92_03545 [Verrucomicrobiae bacterium]|nr:hypothetical protein [Verrucomicrobiae bacterium]
MTGAEGRISRFAREFFSKNGLWALCLLLILPAIFWSVLDQKVWAWDDAEYARQSLEAFMELQRSLGDWFERCTAMMRHKAPGLPVIAQVAVPFGIITERYNASFLILQVLIQLATFGLVVVTYAGRKFVRFDWVTASAVMVLASGPMFLAMGQQFLVEPLQGLCVMWFVLLMTRARTWQKSRLLLHLFALIPLSLYVKISTPLYVLAPALIILWALVRRPPPAGDRRGGPKWETYGLLVCGAGVGFMCVAWYAENLGTIIQFMKSNSAGAGEMAIYGRHSGLDEKLPLWIGYFFSGAAPTKVALVVGILVVLMGGCFGDRRERQKSSSGEWIMPLACGLNVFLVMISFSLQYNEASRYLYAVYPLCLPVLAWVLKKTGEYSAKGVFVVALAGWVHLQGGMFGLWPIPGSAGGFVRPLDFQGQHLSEVRTLVQAVATGPESRGRVVILAASVWWFNPSTLNYYALQNAAARENEVLFLTYKFGDLSQKMLMTRLAIRQPLYVVWCGPEHLDREPALLNKNALMFQELIRRDPQFEKITLPGTSEVTIYKNRMPYDAQKQIDRLIKRP